MEFEKKTGLTHAAIWKIETGKVKNIHYTTLAALAPHLGYTVSELQLILTSNKEVSPQYLVAEDVLPIANQLCKAEKGRLAQMIISQLTED